MKRLINGVVAAAIAATPLAVMGAQDYAEALHLSTKYFGGQRCGNTQSWIHDECHGGDANIDGVDLSGGWHDCGDHVKFGQTNGYAAALLLHSYINYPSSFKDNYSQANSAGSSNNIPDVLDEVKIYTDYALKTLTGGRLYFQVGNPGDADAKDDHFSGAEPVWQTNNEESGKRESHSVTEGASNIAGINAGVLAMMSVAYRDIDDAYATECLNKAKEFFSFGDKKHEAQSSVDRNGSDVDATYSDDTWADEMSFGALQLYKATGDASYVSKAKSFMSTVDFNLPTSWVLDYPTISPLVVYDYLATYDSQNSAYADSLMKEVDSYMSNPKAAGKLMVLEANGTAWGSSKYASAASYVALLYYNMREDAKYLNFAKDNIDFLLGDHDGSFGGNGFSFLAGYGSNYPDKQIHHRAAANIQLTKWDGLWEKWNSTGYDNPKFLEGALVGGPADNIKGDGLNLYYVDERADYFTNEVCIYYNAPFVAAVSAMINLKDGVANNAPADIRLVTTQISSGQPAGTMVSTIAAVDRNLKDNHSFSVVSGDKFEIDGNNLKTKEALTEGDYSVKIKADDGKGGSIEKEFTISVVKGDLPNNVLYELGWFAYTNDTVSTIEPGKEYEDLMKEGVVKAKFNIAKEDPDAPNGGFWPGGSLMYTRLKVKGDSLSSADDATEINFDGIEYIIVEYRTDNNFKLVLPMVDADTNSLTEDDEYSKALKKTDGGLVTDTFYLNKENFKQEGWGTKLDLDLSKVYTPRFEPSYDNASGTIEIQTIVFEGINFKPTAITDPTIGHKATAKISEFSPKSMKITVPSNGVYDINVYSLAGRMIYSTSANISTNGTTIPWNGSAISSGMVLVEIAGNGVRKISRAILK